MGGRWEGDMNTKIAAARLVADRAAQGLPPTVADAAALRRIAEVIRPEAGRQVEGRAKAA